MDHLVTDEYIINRLKYEYIKRKKLNSQYSLRAFAKSLGLSAPAISQLINEKRPLSKKNRKFLIEKLAINESSDKDSNYDLINIDNIEFQSNWIYDAILELTKFKSFNSSPLWIAKRLSISLGEARKAIATLIEKGILVKNENGQLMDVTEGHSTHINSSYETSEARMLYQSNLLKLSDKSLTKVGIESRDHTSMMVAIKKDKVHEAKELLKNFRRQFDQLIGEDEDPDSLYQLCLSFFPLTENEEIQ